MHPLPACTRCAREHARWCLCCRALLLRGQNGRTYRVLAVQLLGLLKCAEHRCWTHNTYPSLTTPKIARTPHPTARPPRPTGMQSQTAGMCNPRRGKALCTLTCPRLKIIPLRARAHRALPDLPGRQRAQHTDYDEHAAVHFPSGGKCTAAPCPTHTQAGVLAARSRRSRAPARGAPEQIQSNVTVRCRVLAAQRSLLLAAARSELHIPYILVLSALRAPPAV